jgi:bifunctional ADP-heptose synthase (sugar kinase/adenylyltransferase)/phosphoglycolate phosphatase-like HAD superfamily hydrolase
MLSIEKINTILEKAEQLSFGVVGDFCLDKYIFLDDSRSEISIETGLKTLAVKNLRCSLGGAGNVVYNLVEMGAKRVKVFGVAGNDPFGLEMRRILDHMDVDHTGLISQDEDWITNTFTKPYIDEEEQARIDYGNFNQMSSETVADLLLIIDRSIGDLDLLIINQQVLSGIHSPEFREGLIGLIKKNSGTLCITDSRSFSDEYAGTFRKINEFESLEILGIKNTGSGHIPLEQLEEVANRLYERWNHPFFISRGDYGCLVQGRDGLEFLPGILVAEPVDTVGAGDSMLAGIALVLAGGEPAAIAAEFGNVVASITIKKIKQTGAATGKEIREASKRMQYRKHPELAMDPRKAGYWKDTEIEIVTDLPDDYSFTNAIFDNDGTISTLRNGWEAIMEPMMINAVLGGAGPAEGDREYSRVQARVRHFIDITTGEQTLLQMKGLVDLVSDMGLVPRDGILDEFGYKKIYNDELMVMVEKRLKDLETGRLDSVDYSMKNVYHFLDGIQSRGLELYLASGTDAVDVERECRALGYYEYFKGRIYGAVGNLDFDPKKEALKGILKDLGTDKARNLVVFGDGPVEMREAKRVGAYAVGIASNEVDRCGLNTAKRKRLIEAGADIIIPDYLCLDDLLIFLFGEAM